MHIVFKNHNKTTLNNKNCSKIYSFFLNNYQENIEKTIKN